MRLIGEIRVIYKEIPRNVRLYDGDLAAIPGARWRGFLFICE